MNDVIDGTVISPYNTAANGGSQLDGIFNGRLFFGGGTLTLMSGTLVNQPAVQTAAPLPAPLWSAAALLAMLGIGSRLRRARASI